MVSGWVHRLKYFFSSHIKGNIKDRLWGLCRTWSDDLYAADPTLEYLYPLPPPTPCSFSVFCHFSCQPAKLCSLKAIKRVFQQKSAGTLLRSFKGEFSGVGGSIKTPLMSHWILSDTFSNDKHGGVVCSHGKSKHHRKLKTHGAQSLKTGVTSHYRKEQNTQTCDLRDCYTWDGVERKRSQDSDECCALVLRFPRGCALQSL